jgi:hypothetical protein
VVEYMIKTLKFFCGLMKKDSGVPNEKEKEV